MILGSFLVLVAGVYRLGRIAATPLVGAIAAALLLTRFDYPFLAARGYIDIPYMALVVWAATLEATRPRRGMPVLILLALAGMLRPEAWFLAGDVLGLGGRGRPPGASASCSPRSPRSARSSGRRRLPRHRRPAVLAALHRALGRGSRPPAPAVASCRRRSRVLREPRQAAVLAAAGVGALLGIVISPRRMLMPLVLLFAGLVTFIAIGVAGASVIERYLAVPALALMVLRRGHGRRLDDALRAGCAPRGWSRAVAIVLARRRLHRDPSEPLALRQRAALPRPGPHRSDRGPERSEGQGRAALRTANRP